MVMRNDLKLKELFIKSVNEGNQWWLLRYSTERENIISEALLDRDYKLLRFRYRDTEYNRIREWTPRYDAEETGTECPDDGQENYSDIENYSDAMIVGDYSPYVIRSESVTVPAGTYNAQYARVEVDYSESAPETGEKKGKTDKLIYEWCISEDVPGKLVRYSWSRPADGVTLTGQLKAVRYSQLESF